MSRLASWAASVLLLGVAATACTGAEIRPDHPGLEIAPLDDVPAEGALYSARHKLYVTDSAEYGVVAFSERDPFRGCRVAYVDDDTETGVPLDPGARFFDFCHGSQYDIGGQYLSGPSEESLRSMPIEVIAGVVYIEANQP